MSKLLLCPLNRAHTTASVVAGSAWCCSQPCLVHVVSLPTTLDSWLLPCAGTQAGTLGCQAVHPHADRRQGPVSGSGRPQLWPGTDGVLYTSLLADVIQMETLTPCLPVSPSSLRTCSIRAWCESGGLRCRCLCCASCWQRRSTTPRPRTTASRRPAAPSSAWTDLSPSGLEILPRNLARYLVLSLVHHNLTALTCSSH